MYYRKIQNKSAETRRQQSHLSEHDRVSASSSFAISLLSKEELAARLKNRTKEAASLKRRYARLEMKKDVEITCDDDICGVLQDCLRHCNENSAKLKAHIIKVLIEATKGYDVDPDNKTLATEIEERATAVCATLSNYAKQVSGKPTTFQFGSRLLRIGLGSWLEGNAANQKPK